MFEPRLISETAEWLVVDKPAGFLSIPGRGEGQVLIDWVRARDPDALVVHRLDRETSGVILFARTADAHRKAGIWFQRHEVRKFYDCLALGSSALPTFRVDEPIEGQPSRTQFEVKARYADAFLAQAMPTTGRRHQIRKHLASKGHPILGDREYRGPDEVAGVRVARVALHARRLELPSGEKFEAAWPEDFARWVSELAAAAGSAP